MRPESPFENMAIHELFETLLPDFVLAFAFFTSVVYAVLGKRFQQQRPAITMSVAIGFALSIGLVWWEQSAGLSIRNLGPIAVGFAILVLAVVMYQSMYSLLRSSVISKGRYGRTREIAIDLPQELTDKIYDGILLNFEIRS